jgi:hypothetical protein
MRRQVRASICAHMFNMKFADLALPGTYARPHLLGAFASLRQAFHWNS